MNHAAEDGSSAIPLTSAPRAEMHFSFFANSRWDLSVPRKDAQVWPSGESLAPLHLASASWTNTTAEQYGHHGQQFLTVPHVQSLVRFASSTSRVHF